MFKHLKVLNISLLGVILSVGLSTAQAQFGAPRNPQDQAGKLSQQYEAFATRTIARYYEEATFLVKAKVETLPPLEEAFGGGDEGDTLSGEVPPQLPGLPFLPETMQPPPVAPSGQSVSAAMQVLTLDVLVDTSYSDRDVEFIKNLLLMATHLDENRGDKVSVHQGVFPRDNRSFQSYRKPMDAPIPPPMMGQPKTDSGKADKENDLAVINPFKSYMDHLPSLIPLLLICLLILACVWMVSRAIVGSSSAKNKEAPAPLPFVPSEPPKTTSIPVVVPGQQPPELAAHRPYLLNCFVGSPKHCGQIIKSWIQRDSEKGLRDSAAMVNSLDGRLMNVLAPELGKDLSQQLEMHLHEGEAPPPEELLVVYKEFKREFQNLSNGHLKEDQYKDLFGFLHQLNDQQIMHILRDESLGIAGLVLAQLPPAAAGAMLQKSDPDNRAKLLISMGNIDHIPLNVYREIADRLSLKALEVGNMRYVAADGVDSILELIDNLPLSLQFNYIHSISEMDLGLGEKIRNRYVTLPEVVALPDKFLSAILQNLDQDTLTLAMVHVDEALRSKVLGLLPERMQMMVSSGVEGAKDTTPKDSEASQKKILHKIRDEIKHSGRPA